MSLDSAIWSDVNNASTAETFFVGSTLLPLPPLVLLLPESCQGLVKTFLPFLNSKSYNSPSSLSTNSSLLASRFPIIIGAGPRVRLLSFVTMCALICAEAGNKCCCAVNSLSRSVGHMESRLASRMSFGNWSPMRSRCRCSRFSQARMACERSSSLAAFGGDKICLLSSKLLPAANGSYKAANLRHCSRPGSRSAPRTTSRASSFSP